MLIIMLSRKQIGREASFLKRVVILVGFREAYFFGKNCLGMIVHPHLTTAKIISKKDFSQAFLVFGLPFNLWLILFFSAFLGWYVFQPTGWILTLGKYFFALSGILLAAVAFYDSYWVTKYLRKRREK